MAEVLGCCARRPRYRTAMSARGACHSITDVGSSFVPMPPAEATIAHCPFSDLLLKKAAAAALTIARVRSPAPEQPHDGRWQ
jgi:hypothetical protein